MYRHSLHLQLLHTNLKYGEQKVEVRIGIMKLLYLEVKVVIHVEQKVSMEIQHYT